MFRACICTNHRRVVTPYKGGWRKGFIPPKCPRKGYHVWQAENRSWTAVKQESERLRRRRGEVEVALVGRLSRATSKSHRIWTRWPNKLEHTNQRLAMVKIHYFFLISFPSKDHQNSMEITEVQCCHFWDSRQAFGVSILPISTCYRLLPETSTFKWLGISWMVWTKPLRLKDGFFTKHPLNNLLFWGSSTSNISISLPFNGVCWVPWYGDIGRPWLFCINKKGFATLPKQFMFDIFTYIHHKNKSNQM